MEWAGSVETNSKERLGASVGHAQRRRRGAGRLAHPALAAEQQELEALLVEK